MSELLQNKPNGENQLKAAVYIIPYFTENSLRFVKAFANTQDLQFGLICNEPLEKLSSELSQKIAAFHQCEDVFESSQLVSAIQKIQQQIKQIDTVVSTNEQLQVPLAQARQALSLTGTSVETANNFRDKVLMKEIFRENGVPCAGFKRVLSDEDAWKFASETGFPLVIKPLAGAGSQATFRVNNAEELDKALKNIAPNPHNEAIIEEFVTGDENSFETITVKGEAVWHSLTNYYPTPLEVVQNPWIQWRIVLPREVDDEKYDDIREAGTRALKALGMDNGISHLEWFRRRDGSIAISEIAARPPGAQIMTLNSRATDTDFYEKWVRLRVWEEFEIPQRKFASGAAYLRGQGNGRVKAIHGLDRVHKQFGNLVTDIKLPDLGQSPAISYEGEGYIIVRHEDTKTVENALERIVSLVRIELG